MWYGLSRNDSRWFSFFGVGIFVLLASFPVHAVAQNIPSPLSLTIAPPYTNVILAPGTRWQSIIEVTNGSAYPVTLRVRAKDVRPSGDGGIVFVERAIAPLPYALATWVEVPQGDVVVHPAQTIAVNYAIDIPLGAEPGGHYAAILIESNAETETPGGIGVSTALSSILLVRVTGAVVESGYVESFEADDIVSRDQVGRFHLRFTNTGNVHIEPRGEIRILNMFGRERGRLQVGGGDAFGPVLPHSTKDYVFSWEGGAGFLDIGVYRARAELSYGSDGLHQVYGTAYFFIFPIIPTTILVLIGLGVILGLKFVVARMTRQVSFEVQTRQRRSATSHQKENSAHRDLIPGRNRIPKFWQSTWTLVFLLMMLGLIGYYFYQVLVTERAFTMQVHRSGPEQYGVE